MAACIHGCSLDAGGDWTHCWSCAQPPDDPGQSSKAETLPLLLPYDPGPHADWYPLPLPLPLSLPLPLPGGASTYFPPPFEVHMGAAGPQPWQTEHGDPCLLQPAP